MEEDKNLDATNESVDTGAEVVNEAETAQEEMTELNSDTPSDEVNENSNVDPEEIQEESTEEVPEGGNEFIDASGNPKA